MPARAHGEHDGKPDGNEGVSVTPGVGLGADVLANVLPFHVAMDHDLVVVQTGLAWPRMAPEVRPGARMVDCFRLLHPPMAFDLAAVRSAHGSSVVLQCLSSGLTLKGQMMSLGEPGVILFLGSPAVRTLAEMRQYGLSLDDWPLHESTADYLSLLESKDLSLDDVRQMATRQTEERNRAEASLALQEATLQLIFDTALDAVITIDRKGRITRWNRQAESLFGWSLDEAIGRTLADLIIPPSLRAAHARGLAHYLATGEGPILGRRIEVPALHREGREFPIELAITPIGGGTNVSFSAFIRDISDRKRNEQLLRTQYEVTRILVSADSAGAAAPRILEATCRLLEWDVGALWLIDGGETRTLRCVDVWHEPESAQLVKFAAASRDFVFTEGVGLPGRVLLSGESLWLENVGHDDNFPRAPLARACGLCSGIALPIRVGARVEGVIEYFSRRLVKPDEETLRVLQTLASQVGQFLERTADARARAESDARTRAVIDNMLEGLVVVTTDFHIVQANAAVARIFGYEEADLPGLSMRQLLPDRPEYQDGLADRYRQSTGSACEWEGRRRDGSLLPIEVRTYDATTSAGPFLGIHVRDLSSQHAADRLKKQFVASVSHELRTPLTAIRGSLDLLNLGAAGELPEAARNLLNLAERNSERLMKIVEDILDFERIQSGVMSTVMAPFGLDEAVARALESLAHMAREAKVSLEAPRCGLSVHGDQARVVQVLVNLVSNAIKFSPPGAGVRIEASDQGEEVEVRVIDEGRGVPESNREFIFEPFRQAEASDSRRHGGAGLGLAICRAIVREHEEEIGVRDRPEGGSLFWFTLKTRAQSTATPHA